MNKWKLFFKNGDVRIIEGVTFFTALQVNDLQFADIDRIQTLEIAKPKDSSGLTQFELIWNTGDTTLVWAADIDAAMNEVNHSIDDLENYEIVKGKEQFDDERVKYLLHAAYKLLKKQENSHYVINLLSEEVLFDGAVCDGHCLMEDIAYELGFDL